MCNNNKNGGKEICQVLTEPDLWVAAPAPGGDVAIAHRPGRQVPAQHRKVKRLHSLQIQSSSPPMDRGTPGAIIRSMAGVGVASRGDAEEALAAAADVEEGDPGKGVVSVEGRYRK